MRYCAVESEGEEDEEQHQRSNVMALITRQHIYSGHHLEPQMLQTLDLCRAKRWADHKTEAVDTRATA